MALHTLSHWLYLYVPIPFLSLTLPFPLANTHSPSRGSRLRSSKDVPSSPSSFSSASSLKSKTTLTTPLQRAISVNQAPNYTQKPLIIQEMLILVAPALFTASIYMSLGRIILLTSGEIYTMIRRTWLTKIFVLGDAVSFLAQAGGTFSFFLHSLVAEEERKGQKEGRGNRGADKVDG